MKRWAWAGATAVGTAHIDSCLPCQDFAAVAEYIGKNISVVVGALSDGAGSSARSQQGSRIAVTSAHRCVRAFLSNGGQLKEIDDKVCCAWLKTIRAEIRRAASEVKTEPREFAATLCLLISSGDTSVVLQVGDSCCVVRSGEKWSIPIWPMKGEYANQTCFVTDTSLQFQTRKIYLEVDFFCLFSDGLERLVLESKTQKPFAPFFDGLEKIINSTAYTGRSKKISHSVKAFLDSERICTLTDDDKSLIFGIKVK